MIRLLVIDDDATVLLQQVSHLFPARDIEIAVATTGTDGLDEVARIKPDVVLLDVALPDLSGLEVYQRLRGIDARIPVIFITATTTTDTAIEAMRQGAFDYLFKPVNLSKLETIVTRAIELGRRMREPASVGRTPAGDERGDAIIGRCPAMLEVYKAIGRVADQKVIVLITGESGTGKELVARAIYQHSDRAAMPFLAINCAAIPENLLESEMFGHERGAFTGADRRRIGKFEQCNGGTIFLDEIGDMPLATQGKILRLLQDQHFERIGSNDTIRTDVRVIAATNHDLKSASEQGRFRPDLFYRLSVFTIHLPPLRERNNDLSMLIDFYLRQLNRELDREVREVDDAAMQRLQRHDWPGNVRELQSVLMQAMVKTHGRVLMSEMLLELATPQPARDSAAEPQFARFVRERMAAGTNDLHAEAHRELDRLLIAAVFQATNGNQLQAAKRLGISRQTLRTRLREAGLHIGRSVEPNADSPSRRD